MRIIPATRSSSIPGFWFLSGTRGIFITRISIATRRNRRAESGFSRKAIASINRRNAARKGVMLIYEFEDTLREMREFAKPLFDQMNSIRGKSRAYRTRRHYSRPDWV